MATSVGKELAGASARFDEGTLSVATGKMERRWRWTGRGFVTTLVRNTRSDFDWKLVSQPMSQDAAGAAVTTADWLLPGLAADLDTPDRDRMLAGSKMGVFYPASGENPEAELRTVSIETSTDDGFTSEHLLVITEIEYPEAHVALQFRVWVYPGAPGVRTQLLAKALPGFEADATRFTGRVELLPVAIGSAMKRRAIGYYNDTQNRNDPDTDILQDQLYDAPFVGPEWYRRPSALCIEDGEAGIALVKESHKCPNQRGHDTGLFHLRSELGLVCTGWGLLPSEFRTDRYREAWAHWTLLWSGGDVGRETAFKRFDAIRYPIDPQRDVYVIANTWGSSWNGETARGAAAESIVREEIDSQADLGIDVQQIDDGWQGNNYDAWRPVESMYPQGWGPIREYAATKGVRLGLWAAAMPVGLDDLKRNFDDGGFLQYKLDFAQLRNRDEIEDLMQKMRDFVLYTGHAVRVNWDVTENPARYGYFFGREYGHLYLENRKPAWPHSAVYIPHTVLRDVWELSKYLNLHKIQCSVQNIDRVDPDLSDAYLHNHAYCVAITLMGTPIFFQQTRFYSKAARDAIRPILSAYKKHRDEMYSGVVYPIGEKPNNRSWPGFQCILPQGNSGYLTVFRELHSGESRRSIALKAAANREVVLTDLLGGETMTLQCDGSGAVEFAIDQPADFRFYRYELR